MAVATSSGRVAIRRRLKKRTCHHCRRVRRLLTCPWLAYKDASAWGTNHIELASGGAHSSRRMVPSPAILAPRCATTLCADRTTVAWPCRCWEAVMRKRHDTCLTTAITSQHLRGAAKPMARFGKTPGPSQRASRSDVHYRPKRLSSTRRCTVSAAGIPRRMLTHTTGTTTLRQRYARFLEHSCLGNARCVDYTTSRVSISV